MDDLITSAFAALMKSAPLTGAVALILYLMRNEIKALLTAGNRDTDMERLMGEQVEMFRKNLEYFGTVAGHTNTMQEALVDIRASLTALNAIQERVIVEIVRQNGSRR